MGCRNFTNKIISEVPPLENSEGHAPHCTAITKTEDHHSPKLHIKIPVPTEERTHSQTVMKTDRLRPSRKTIGVNCDNHTEYVTQYDVIQVN
jgi:hypothetical protein